MSELRDAPSHESPEPSTARSELRREFEAGLALAKDPDNAHLSDSELRVTTHRSPWYGKPCRECHLKFREGDQARLCPVCETAYHDDPQYALGCWSDHFADSQPCTKGETDSRFSSRGVQVCEWRPDSDPKQEDGTPQNADASLLDAGATLSSFLDGLKNIWRPFGDEEIRMVEKDSDLAGRSCPWCRFRLRPGDSVVACPCGCGTHFHQDVFRHLTCWNEWNGVSGHDFCPNTGRSYSSEKSRERTAGETDSDADDGPRG